MALYIQPAPEMNIAKLLKRQLTTKNARVYFARVGKSGIEWVKVLIVKIYIFQFLARKWDFGLFLSDQSSFWIVRWDTVGMQK